eukprot:9409910-Pyramimonas_sp.AAC.1
MPGDFQRIFFRERPVGFRVDEIAPMDDISQTQGHLHTDADQCSTGLRDSDGTPIKQPIEVMANHRAVLQSIENKRCSGKHERAQARNLEVAQSGPPADAGQV